MQSTLLFLVPTFTARKGRPALVWCCLSISASTSAISHETNSQSTHNNFSFSHTFYILQTFLPAAEVQERILTVIKNFDKVDPAKVQSTSKFGDDLGLDSLDAVEVVMAIEDEFAIEIPDAEADRIGSVGEAVEYVAAHPMAK